jgi:hypothetical protein
VWALLLCALSSAVLVTGCGGGGGTSTPSTPKHATGPTNGVAAPVPLRVRLRQTEAACRKGMAASAFLTAAEKPVAEADCGGIKTGHIAPVVSFFLEICEKAVIARVPPAQQAAATKACKKVY